ncbi:MAG: YdeI family protein [bacterium]
MKSSRSVDEYMEKQPAWERELKILREIIRSANLDETVKWGGPVYTLNGNNLVGLGAFKSYVSLWFFQGALLKDDKNKLINAQENKTKALRQWRFSSHNEIREDADVIKQYLAEAMANENQGNSIKPDRQKPLIIPPELEAFLSDNAKLKESFTAFSKSKQREYAEYIDEAKREETKQKRLQKIASMILQGIGLHDRYRK